MRGIVERFHPGGEEPVDPEVIQRVTDFTAHLGLDGWGGDDDSNCDGGFSQRN
jgi:hypothetical protein